MRVPGRERPWSHLSQFHPPGPVFKGRRLWRYFVHCGSGGPHSATARELRARLLGTLEAPPPPVFSEMEIGLRLPNFSSDLSLSSK